MSCAVFQPLAEQILRPGMVVILRLLAMTGILAATKAKPLMLFLVYFKVLLAPKPVNSLEVNKPALSSKLYCYSAIAVSGMLYM